MTEGMGGWVRRFRAERRLEARSSLRPPRKTARYTPRRKKIVNGREHFAPRDA